MKDAFELVGGVSIRRRLLTLFLRLELAFRPRLVSKRQNLFQPVQSQVWVCDCSLFVSFVREWRGAGHVKILVRKLSL
ncbi:hypothetical protein D3C80_2100070 [compost metagenome]